MNNVHTINSGMEVSVCSCVWGWRDELKESWGGGGVGSGTGSFYVLLSLQKKKKKCSMHRANGYWENYVVEAVDDECIS